MFSLIATNAITHYLHSYSQKETDRDRKNKTGVWVYCRDGHLFWEDLVCSEKSTVCLDSLLVGFLLGLLGLLGQKNSLDVGQYTTLGNGHSRQQLVQLLVITDGQLQMTGDDPCLLVVTGSISC